MNNTWYFRNPIIPAVVLVICVTLSVLFRDRPFDADTIWLITGDLFIGMMLVDFGIMVFEKIRKRLVPSL